MSEFISQLVLSEGLTCRQIAGLANIIWDNNRRKEGIEQFAWALRKKQKQ